MNINLGEKANSNLSQTIILLLDNILIAIKHVLFTKEYSQITKIQRTKKYIYNKENEIYITELINAFIPIIIKCLFYYDSDSVEIMETLMYITYNSKINEKLLTTYSDLFSQ